MNKFHRALAVVPAVLLCSVALAQAPDNTRQNQVDPLNKSASADSQQNNQTDLALTKQIRASVMADKSLSTYAHNVKIVAVNGNVTLNGVVHTQDEKDAVQAKAQAAVKNGSVVNNLKVKP